MADLSSNQDKMQRWFTQAQGTTPKPQGTIPAPQQVPAKPTAIPQDMGALPPLSFDNTSLDNLPFNPAFSNPNTPSETPQQAFSRSNTFLRPGMTVNTLPRILTQPTVQPSSQFPSNPNPGGPTTADLIAQARRFQY